MRVDCYLFNPHEYLLKCNESINPHEYLIKMHLLFVRKKQLHECFLSVFFKVFLSFHMFRIR